MSNGDLHESDVSSQVEGALCLIVPCWVQQRSAAMNESFCSIWAVRKIGDSETDLQPPRLFTIRATNSENRITVSTTMPQTRRLDLIILRV